MAKLIVPDYLYYLMVGLYIMNLTISVVISVGWLTCANYFYRMCDIFDNITIGLFNMFVIIITALLILSHFVSDATFGIGILGTNALFVAACVLFVLIGLSYDLITNTRKYFANKRGRKID